MPSISTTTLDALETLMVTVIEGLEPRVQFGRSSGWKHYTKAHTAPSRLRRFTTRWVPGPFVPGGYFTSGAVDVEAELVVRVDYSGRHENLQALVQDDLQQIRFALNTLTSDITSGLILLLEKRTPATLATDTPSARALQLGRSAANSDTFQADLIYRVQYHQAS